MKTSDICWAIAASLLVIKYGKFMYTTIDNNSVDKSLTVAITVAGAAAPLSRALESN
jgi:hypothetical protein